MGRLADAQGHEPPAAEPVKLVGGFERVLRVALEACVQEAPGDFAGAVQVFYHPG